MDEIIDHMGRGLLAVVGTLGFYEIYSSLLTSDGVIYNAVLKFMTGICG